MHPVLVLCVQRLTRGLDCGPDSDVWHSIFNSLLDNRLGLGNDDGLPGRRRRRRLVVVIKACYNHAQFPSLDYGKKTAPEQENIIG